MVGHAYVSDANDALAAFYPYYPSYLLPLYKEPMPHDVYRCCWSRQGSLVAGSPQQVTDKLVELHAATGCHVFAGQIDIGTQPFAQIMEGIELLATKVAPVLGVLGKKPATAATRDF